MDGGDGEVLVGDGNLAFHVVLLDEPCEGLTVDGKGEQEVGDVVVLAHQLLEGNEIRLDGFISYVEEETLDERICERNHRQILLEPLLAGDVLLDVLQDPAVGSVVKALRDVPTRHAVDVKHELTVYGVDAVDIVAVDNPQKMVEDLDVLFDELLAAEYLVGDSCFTESVDKDVHVLEVLAEDGSVVQVVDSLDEAENGQGLAFGSF